MKHLLLSKLCSPIVDSQSSDVRLDRRLTVGSPSGLTTSVLLQSFLRNAAVLCMLLCLGVGNVWGDESWDLTKNSYSSSSNATVTWSGTNASMTLTKQSSSTNANNYLGGSGSYVHTRVYSGQRLTITPASGQTISSIEITATGNSYTISGTWTNGSAKTSSSTTTVTPTDGTKAVYCACDATKRLTKVVVKFAAAATYNVYLMSGCTGGSYSSNKGTSGSGTGTYSSCTKYSGISAGTSVTITATPSSGYQFNGWTDSGYSIIFDDESNEITPSSTTSTTATFTMPSSDVVIWQCNFSESCASSVSIATGSPTNCTISASAASVSTCSGTRQVTISVTPNTCYAAPVDASVTSSGTAVTKVSGPTKNGNAYDYVYQFAQNATGATTFSASLTTTATYTVNYAAGSVPSGGGSVNGSHANDTKTCGTNMTLPGATFTTTGYTQTGWSKTNGGSQYAAVGGSYTDNAAQTFYPVWTANKYTVTWSVNGSTYTTTANVSHGSTISTPAVPSVPSACMGSKFMGWTTNSSYSSDSAPGDLFNETTPMITGNVTYYAVFADYED